MTPDPDESAAEIPFDGTVLLQTGALASVAPTRLGPLLRRVQSDLAPRLGDYRREYERAVAEADREAFLVEPAHWDAVAERLGLTDRERDAVERAHEAQLERLGSVHGRRAELESALEIRSAVVIATGD
ncbi:hypothetical protein GCM10027435_16760 [Haloparvum alkalitolerans]|uniref:hypothetical protein n=1 Tax=Haloparvum alkalitolerans TaxID=1042953 RepID=UPI003CF816D4